MNCKRGRFFIIRQHEVRDLTAESVAEACNDVSIEPALMPLSGERFTMTTTSTENDARCDVGVRELWMCSSKAFFDVRLFNPTAKSYAKQSLEITYNSLEEATKAKYNEGILNPEHGTFTPLVVSCFGGLGK